MLSCRIKQAPWLFKRHLKITNTRNHSDGIIPTTLSRLEVAEQAPLISAYSTLGFTLRGVRVIGSVALLPRGFFHWNINQIEDMRPEAFALFHMVVPRLEILVIGTGSKLVFPDAITRQFLRSKGISIEVQDTPNACATFNFLLDDGRMAGAALLPPTEPND